MCSVSYTHLDVYKRQLLFALAACTQDELADDSRLSKEEYPIVIHATGLSVEAVSYTHLRR